MSLSLAAATCDRRAAGLAALVLLALVLLTAILLSVSLGAAGVPLADLSAALAHQLTGAGDPPSAATRAILFDIRLPRIAMGAMVGALLAVSGAIMQGLFRNPLADPGLVGVSSGASLGAVTAIVLGGGTLSPATAWLGDFRLPVFAFIGGLTVTAVLYAVATRRGRTSVATMLLAGIALAALAMAFTGTLIYLSDDRQLRDITFWSLGSLGGATWVKAAVIVLPTLAILAAMPLIARGLNGLVLGEDEARHLGIPIEALKRGAIVLVALAIGAAVAFCGTIGFVGLVVPHLLRLSIGPDHTYLLPASALAGASLILCADLVARTIVAPAELPIGIIMALIGAPFFLWLLLRRRGALEI